MTALLVVVPYGLAVSAATDSWAAAFAAAMRTELSLAAFAAQGYVTRNSLNYGHVPPFITPGNAASTAWDKVSAAVSRLPELAAAPPTLVVSAHGFNDQAVNDPSAVTAAVAAWLAAMRAAVGRTAGVLLAVPFGGEMRDRNATRDAVLEGFAAYRATPGGAADACTIALDLYPAAQRGLQGLGVPTAESCDGTHPLAQRHAQLGAMLAAAATAALAGAPGCAGAPVAG